MKSKFIKKLCVYAVSASMVLPASAPVMATTTTPIVRDYSFNLLEMNYTSAYLYEGDSLQLRTTHPASKINKVPGKLTWTSSNPKEVGVSTKGKVTAKKVTTEKFVTVYLKKGTTTIAKCDIAVRPRIKFSTQTRTAKKGTTLKVYIPDDVINSTSSNSNIVKNMWKMGYVDNYGKHYLKLKCQNKGTATITLQVHPTSTDKKVYDSKKTFKFKVNVK